MEVAESTTEGSLPDTFRDWNFRIVGEVLEEIYDFAVDMKPDIVLFCNSYERAYMDAPCNTLFTEDALVPRWDNDLAINNAGLYRHMKTEGDGVKPILVEH